MPADILIVDDENDICDLVCGILSDEGYQVRTAENTVTAFNAIVERQPSLVILDVWLGDSSKDGLKILEIVKRDHPYVPVIMISGHGTVETAVAAIKLGAYDFIEKPFQTEKLLVTISRALESSRLKRENTELREKIPFFCSLVGTSLSVQNIKQAIDSTATTSATIFLHGPIGSDRAAVARYIHECSYSTGPFFAINCATDPLQIDSELFGLETIIKDDNIPRKIGLLEQAHGGTFFIDNISYLLDSLQIRLNQFLQFKSFSRIGGTNLINVNVRVISGSNLNEEEILTCDTFRQDLYYRMRAVYISIPPLIERAKDIPLLIKQFASAIAASHNISPKNFSVEAIALLESYPWPGDIQQFKNIIEWILIMHSEKNKDIIEVNDLPPEIIEGNLFAKAWNSKTAKIATMPIKEAREAFERDYIVAQLKRFNGHISQTARFIGIDRASLHRKLKTLGLTVNDDIEEES
ncbi:MAG: sigma-54 dependent transcriptional regulator [Holosporales bacterium]|nr:sigma-54 dependent transcriptional regulator [Holosporales bacterium]